jgi:GGDEF domain-containing protein
MFQTSKPAASKVLRLPKQMALPGQGDLDFVREQATKVIGRSIDLPFSLAQDAQDKEHEFILRICLTAAGTEPVWALIHVAPNGEQMLWQHSSSDTSLIYSLIKEGAGAIKFSAPKEVSDPLAATNRELVATERLTTGIGISQILNEALVDERAVASGNLKVTPIPALLKTIGHQKMTGKLAVENKQETCEVYFIDGIPIHCLLKETAGELAIKELMTWRNGEYRFYTGQKTLALTISTDTETILQSGLTLLEQLNYLETNNLHMESCLIRKNSMISEEELRIRLSKTAPDNVEQQIDFYELVDNHSTIFELLAKRPLAKAEWVPIIFNLVSSALVQISDQVSQQNRLANLKSFGVDENELQMVSKSFLKAETSILTYPAFIYFLDQEYMRYQYFNFPFSVIVFSLGLKKGEHKPVENLPAIAIRRAMQRISQVKRPVDILGHFETSDFAMLLPNSNASAAGATANRIIEVLSEAPLTSDIDTRTMWSACGIATIPEDCQEMDKLLQAAKKARDQARHGRERIILARGVAPE